MTNQIFKLAIVAAAIVGFGAGEAQAQVVKKGSGYQFRIKLAKGKTTKLKLNAVVPYPGQPKPMTFSTIIASTVTAVTGNVATVNGQVGPTKINGQPMTEKPMASTMKIDSTGKTVGKGAGSSSFVTYPANPVKVGGTWAATVPLSGIGGGTAAATYKFLGMKTVNGKQVADLSVTINANGKQRATGGGRVLILASDGLPLKMDLKLTITDPQNAGKAIVAPMTLIRI